MLDEYKNLYNLRRELVYLAYTYSERDIDQYYVSLIRNCIKELDKRLDILEKIQESGEY